MIGGFVDEDQVKRFRGSNDNFDPLQGARKKKLAFLADESTKGGGRIDPPPSTKKCKFFLKIKKNAQNVLKQRNMQKLFCELCARVYVETCTTKLVTAGSRLYNICRGGQERVPGSQGTLGAPQRCPGTLLARGFPEPSGTLWAPGEREKNLNFIKVCF